MEKLKNMKGITLIALVITIVVLLILAGVTIAMLTGDNGILTKAQSAKKVTADAEIEEKLRLAVMASKINVNNTIDTETLKIELNNQFGAEGTGWTKTEVDSNTWKVVVNGKSYKIDLTTGAIGKVTGIIVSATSSKVLAGKTATITATLDGIDKTGDISFTANPSSAATISDINQTAEGATATVTIASNATGSIDIEGKLDDEHKEKCTIKVVLDVTNATVNSSLEVEIGSTLDIAKCITNIDSIEDFTITNVTGNATKENETTIKGTGTEDGAATITITGTSSKITHDITVAVKKPKELEIGDYVEYDVTYTHMYSNLSIDNYQPYTFSKMDGWRVLDPGTNENGIYTGVKLISTGIPAFLSYDYNSIKSFEKDGSQGKWAGDETDRRNYVDTFSLGSYDKNDVYATSGLYYNFRKILFTQGTSANGNYGYYTKVNNKTTGNLSEDEFIIQGKAKEVHNLTLAELNKARGATNLGDRTSTDSWDADTGLFNLTQLHNEVSGVEDLWNTFTDYWLATPDGHLNSYLCVMQSGVHMSNIGSHNGGLTNGVRPVVTLESGISITKSSNGVWTIN